MKEYEQGPGDRREGDINRFRTILFSLNAVVSDIACSVKEEPDVERAAEALKFVVKQLELELPRYSRQN